MTRLIFSVYDSKAETFMQPFFTQSRGVAIRMFTSAVADKAHDFNRFAEDYTLFELGAFDEEAGCFQNHDTPVSVATGIAIRAAAAAASQEAE